MTSPTALTPEPEAPALAADDPRPPSALAGDEWRKREIGIAVSNATKMGSSLLVTFGITLMTRLYMPRFLGPDRFGILNFAEAFATTAFVAIGFGLDTYVRKEISVRPQHASDFIGGIIVLRFSLLFVIAAAMEIVLRLTHRTADIKLIVYFFGAVQFFLAGSATSEGMLQAAGKVNELSLLSIFTKFLYAGGILLCIALRLPLWAFALAPALCEGVRSLLLFRLARKNLGFTLTVDARATWRVLAASLPFFVSGLAVTVYGKLGVSLLAFMTTDREVGWLGAAQGLSGMTLMFVPVVAWVVTPLLARSHAASEEGFYSIVRRSLELILTLSIPVSLFTGLGAELWVSLLVGRAFVPAARALQVLSIATVFMYASIIACYSLAVLNRTWRMSLVFVAAMIFNPTCTYFAIRVLAPVVGPGGGGLGCSVATVLTEMLIVCPLLYFLGRRAFDRRSVSTITKTVGVSAAVIVSDVYGLRALGNVHLLLAAVMYCVLIVTTGALDIRYLRSWVQGALRSRAASRGA